MSVLARRGSRLAALGASVALAAGLLVVAPQAADAAVNIGYEGQVQSTATGTFASLPDAATSGRGEHKVWYAGGSWWAAMPNVGSTGLSIHRLDGRESDSPSWTDTNVVIDSRASTSADALYNPSNAKLFIASHTVVSRNTDANPAGNNDALLTRYSLVDGAWVKDEGWPIVILPGRALTSISIAQMSDGKVMAVYTNNAGPYAANTVTSASGVTAPVFTAPFKVQWTQNKLLVADLQAATTLSGDDSAVVTAADGFVTIVFSNQRSTDVTVGGATIPAAPGYYVARHRVGDVYGTGNFFGTKVSLGTTDAFAVGGQMSVLTDPTSSTTSPVYLALRTNLDSEAGGRTPVASDPLIQVVKLQPRAGGGVLTSQNSGYVTTVADRTLRTVADRGSRPVLTLDNARRSLDAFYAAPQDPTTVGLTAANHTGVIYAQSMPLDTGLTPSAAEIVMQDSASGLGNAANKPDGMSHPTAAAQVLGGSSGTLVLATDTVAADLNAPTLSLTRKFWHNDLFRSTSASFVAQIPVANDNTAGLRVEFTDTSLGRPNAWAWDFGDGATSTAQNPTHTYAGSGSKTVSLTVTNANGSSSTVTKSVVVGQAPAANFSKSLPNRYRLLVQVKDISTGAPDSLQWTFGDGSAPVSSSTAGSIARHVYAKAGTYTITLKATNGAGFTTKSINVVVNATPAKIAKPTRTVLSGRKVVVAWKAPKPNGLTITKYQAICRSTVNTRSAVVAAKDFNTQVGRTRTATVTSLTAGRSYTCTVKAYNARGWNLPSVPSSTFTARA